MLTVPQTKNRKAFPFPRRVLALLVYIILSYLQTVRIGIWYPVCFNIENISSEVVVSIIIV